MARTPVVHDADAPPEADRLEGFPHPRETRHLFGFAGAERELSNAMTAGRIHHAWLLAGSEGIGKATLAYRFAAYALARAPERRSDGSLALHDDVTAVRLVRAMSHPDLLVLRRPWDPKGKRFAATIPVDEVRRLRTFLGLTAGGGSAVPGEGWRIVIVDQADELNTSSANALLKSLEEPPPRTLFLLISSQPGRLLATIRSRCRLLALPQLGPQDLRAAAVQAIDASGGQMPAEADWPLLTRLACGSVRRLVSLTSGDGSKLAGQVRALFQGLPGLDWSATHRLAEDLATATAAQRFDTFLDILLDLWARLARTAVTGEGPADEVELSRRLMPQHKVGAWSDLWEEAVRKRNDVATLNLDRRALILDILGGMQSLARA